MAPGAVLNASRCGLVRKALAGVFRVIPAPAHFPSLDDDTVLFWAYKLFQMPVARQHGSGVRYSGGREIKRNPASGCGPWNGPRAKWVVLQRFYDLLQPGNASNHQQTLRRLKREPGVDQPTRHPISRPGPPRLIFSVEWDEQSEVVIGVGGRPKCVVIRGRRAWATGKTAVAVVARFVALIDHHDVFSSAADLVLSFSRGTAVQESRQRLEAYRPTGLPVVRRKESLTIRFPCLALQTVGLTERRPLCLFGWI